MKRRSIWIGAAGLLVLLCIVAAVAIPRVQHLRAQTRLRLAIDENQPKNLAEIAELVKQGQDIRTTGTLGGTVAMVAAYWNDPVLLQATLDGGVDPNAEMPADGHTALISAMWAPSTEPINVPRATANTMMHKSAPKAPAFAIVAVPCSCL
jgi:hypothetical protein